MSLKTFMQNFLYEESDEDETEEQPQVQEEAKPEPQTTPAQPVQPVQPEPVVQPAPSYPQPELDSLDLQTDAMLAEESKPESFLSRISSSMDMDLDDEQPAKKTVRKTERRNAKPKRKAVREEYSAVISPIFGNLPEDKKDHEAIHDAINLPRPTDAIDMVEVISPMYGSRQAAPKKPAQPRTKKAAPEQESRSALLPATEEELEGFEEKPAPKTTADYLLSGAPKAKRTNTNALIDSAVKGSQKK